MQEIACGLLQEQLVAQRPTSEDGVSCPARRVANGFPALGPKRLAGTPGESQLRSPTVLHETRRSQTFDFTVERHEPVGSENSTALPQPELRRCA